MSVEKYFDSKIFFDKTYFLCEKIIEYLQFLEV